MVAAPLLRRRYARWGAEDDEVTGGLPGDDLVPVPGLGYTRATTIDAPPSAVWPWLAQIGQGRGGLYSFDGLENLVGCRIHSADAVRPDLQDLRPGDLVRLGPVGYPCFRVHLVDPPHALVLVGVDPRPPHAAGTTDPAAPAATWQWALRPADGGRRTRLLVRQRLAFPRRQWLLWHLVEPVGFVMERQMLRGLRRRATGG